MKYIDIAKKYRAKKRLGQNFLIDEEVLKHIVESADIQRDETVIEIGAGLGFVTELLAQKAKKVIAIEIDHHAVEYLNAHKSENVEIVEQDILKTELSSLVDEPVKVIANIPYYITSPIIVHLLGEVNEDNHSNRGMVKELTLMVQKEVASRLAATNTSKNKEYGSITILTNYWAEVEKILDVGPKSFWPRPKVDSAILKITPRKESLIKVINPNTLKRVVKAIFNFRRKNLKNALSMSGFSTNIVNDALEELNIKEGIRGETLSIVELGELSDKLYLLNQGENKQCQ